MGGQVRMAELDCLWYTLEKHGRRNDDIVYRSPLVQDRLARWNVLFFNLSETHVNIKNRFVTLLGEKLRKGDDVNLDVRSHFYCEKPS